MLNVVTRHGVSRKLGLCILSGLIRQCDERAIIHALHKHNPLRNCLKVSIGNEEA